MFQMTRDHSDRTELMRIVSRVRHRWRIKRLLRGVAVAAGATLGSTLLAAWLLEQLRFSPGSILALRIVVGLIVAAVTVFFVLRPLLRRVTDEQVARYIEEHDPGLDAALVSAVEAARTGGEGPAQSSGLLNRLIESAVSRCDRIDFGRSLEQSQLQRYAGVATTVTAVGLALFFLGPDYLRQGVSALVMLSRSVEAASPYRVEVVPGDATIPRGADQTISATLVGFQAQDAELMIRRGSSAAFERVPLVPDDSGAFEGMLFDVTDPVEYFVDAAGVRSPTFTLEVVDLPYVQRLELEYRFPEYTGLSPQTVENGGDIAVLRGTEVRLRAFPTVATGGGRVVLDDDERRDLRVESDGTLVGSFVVDRDGLYRIELDGPRAQRVAASPQYTIDVLTDQPPVVSFARPGRDVSATALEEVFVEARAEDDFGIERLDLVYSANGGPEKTVPLFGGARESAAEISAGHTFYLEELGLEAGDFVSYYAKARDNNRVAEASEVKSDLYFMQIRPFGKDFKPAVSQAGGGGGGMQQVGALSQQQREIVSATFNVVRDRRTLSADKVREHAVVIALSQAKLREQVESLVTRLTSRLVEPDPSFQKIAELLPRAVEEMKAAEAELQAIDPEGALPPEQRALQYLQKAEEEYEVQVSTSRGGGGGAGGQGQMAEDLADLFELELDKLANQYETRERADTRSANQQLDELAEKLKDLARRQEQEAERQRRRSAAGQPSQGGGSSQRALAEQVEEAARRLERLSREQQRQDLAEAARQLQQAADAMRRAAAGGDPSATAQAASAVEQLREAQRRLDKERAAQGERDIQDALRRADALSRAQEEIAAGVDQLAASGELDRDRIRGLMQRKETLEAGVADLERQIEETANDIRRGQREAARKLQDAAGQIRDDKIKEKIRYSRGMLRGGAMENAPAFEQEIARNLDSLRENLGEAAQAVGRSEADRQTEALDRARDLARGMESLERRMRERAESGAGEPGQSGGPGERAGQQDSTGPQGRTPNGRGAEGDTMGPWGGAAGGGSRRPTGFSPQDVRQFRSEVRERMREAQELNRLLREEGVDTGDLGELLQALRALDSDRVYQDASELERLQTFVTEGVKRFEFSLRRQFDLQGEEIALTGSEEVPAEYRDEVEQYYRALAGGRPGNTRP